MATDLKETAVPLAEISQGPNAFEEFLDRNQKSLIVLAILLALGTAAFVVYQGIEKSRQETAGEAFDKADDLASLQAVISEHAGTHAAQSAMILLADRQWSEGQQDTAIETLRSFLSGNPEHPAAPTAKASLASKLMSQGKSDEAAGIFQELVDDPAARYIAPFALISIGDMAKVAGETDKAETAYKRVTADFSESVFVQTASSRLASLKAKTPVEIEAPPALETETPPLDLTNPGSFTTPPPFPEPAPDTTAPEPPPADSTQPETAPEAPPETSSGEPPSDSNP